MAGLKQQLDKIDNLSLRERVILLGGGLILIFMIWFNFFYEPLQSRKTALKTEIDQKQGEAETLSLQLRVLREKKQPDPNEANRQKREQLLTDLEASKNSILKATANLVAPDNMPELLKSILARTEGLQLVSLKGLGKTPLIEPAKTEDKDNADETDTPEVQMETAYKHGMKIVFEGDFLSTVDYIRKLENLDWRFFWDSIEFRVEDYPRSLSSITLYTLSLDQNWIGI